MGIHRYGRKTVLLALAGALGMALTSAATLTAAMTPAPLTTVAPAGDTDSAKTEAGHGEADIAALNRLRRQQEDAWARGDGNAYAAIYAADADLVNLTGEHLETRNTIATHIQSYFNNQLNKTRLLKLEEKVRFVTPSMAVIIRKGCVLYGAETACRPDTLSINTSVAVKQAGRWMITCFQNTLVRPGGPRPPSRRTN